MKFEKVKEPSCEVECWECPRCNKTYCPNCVENCQVDFKVIDGSDHKPTAKIEWSGLFVCPWCYNQLLEKRTL